MAAAAALLPASASADGLESGEKVAPGVYAGGASSLEIEGSSHERAQPRGPAERQPRIVGGTPIDISQARWQAAIAHSPAFDERNAFDRQFCGGTVVAPTVVITAAHCLFNDTGTAPGEPPEELSVITGRTVLSSDQGQELPVSDYFVYTDGSGRFLYNPQNSAWDVAVIHLAQPTSTASSLQLPGPSERELWSNGRSAFVSGWGTTRYEGRKSDQLLAVEVYLAPEGACELAFGGPRFFDDETSICAGVFNGGRDACQGDSGGPFVVPSAEGVPRLAGNVESGVRCADPRSPGAYGRFGSDPMQSALRNTVSGLAGVDIVGSGLTAPTTVSIEQAADMSGWRIQAACNRSRSCTRARSDQCQPFGGGIQCRERITKITKRGKKVCTEHVLFDASGGALTATRVGKRSCKRK